jgi:23S rRNA pseudouridine2605 synthase
VRVNGTVIKEPGTQVEPERDRVQVHGRPIPGAARQVYVMLHKPVGVLTTLSDPEGRRTVRELLPPGPRLFPVGRLDADSSGLLLLTNDGDLAHHLMHPRYGVRKVYRVRVDALPDAEQMRRLREGVAIERGVATGPADVRLRSTREGRVTLEIAVHEGRYRQVRRMCEAVGLTVKALQRSAYGPLTLGELARGAWRPLSLAEVRRLKTAGVRPARPRSLGQRARAPGRPSPRTRPARATAVGARRGRPPARPRRRPTTRRPTR